MNSIILMSTCISVALACSCLPQSANSAYCEADWVSRVQVIFHYDPQPNENSGMHNIIYFVRHVWTYKKPSYVSHLPIIIYTPSEGATCGIYLSVGEQYLLSGNGVSNGTMRSYLCGQVNDYGGASPTEWNGVSQELRSNLTKFDC